MSRRVSVPVPSPRRSGRRAHYGVGLLSFLLAFVAPSPALGGGAPPEFRVIVHPSVPGVEVSRELLANVFLKNVTRWPNDQLTRPVDQRPDTDVRRRFSESVLRRSVSAVKVYWQQRIFSGRGVPPPELDSDDAIVHYVENNPGAVGYVSGTAAIGKLKVLVVTP
jgi:ABC-type phosphate transport system substrate-binding protein